MVWVTIEVLACVVGVIYSTPLFIIIVIPIAVAYGYLQVSVTFSSVTLLIVTLSFTDNYCLCVTALLYQDVTSVETSVVEGVLSDLLTLQ
mgnify:CR=1 FL=1